MGIQGLLPLIKDVQRDVHVSKFSGRTLGVDAYVWLHRGAYGCAADLVAGKETTSYINLAVSRIRMLLHHGVTPYLVFDGDRLPAKAKTEAARQQRREENLAHAKKLLEQGRGGSNNAGGGGASSAHDAFARCVDVTPHMAHQLIKVLRRMKLPYIVAPYEADAQLAYLERTGAISGVITEDSDLLVFGCRLVLFKLDAQGRCAEVERERLRMCRNVCLAGFGDDMLRQMAILSGCDYLDSIPGIGLKLAHRYLSKFRTVPKALSAIRLEGSYRVPATYAADFAEAERTFVYQRVFDRDEATNAVTLVHLHPLPAQQPRQDGPEAALGDEWACIGAAMASDVAQAIADGDMDPISRAWFPRSPSPGNDDNDGDGVDGAAAAAAERRRWPLGARPLPNGAKRPAPGGGGGGYGGEWWKSGKKGRTASAAAAAAVPDARQRRLDSFFSAKPSTATAKAATQAGGAAARDGGGRGGPIGGGMARSASAPDGCAAAPSVAWRVRTDASDGRSRADGSATPHMAFDTATTSGRAAAEPTAAQTSTRHCVSLGILDSRDGRRDDAAATPTTSRFFGARRADDADDEDVDRDAGEGGGVMDGHVCSSPESSATTRLGLDPRAAEQGLAFVADTSARFGGFVGGGGGPPRVGRRRGGSDASTLDTATTSPSSPASSSASASAWRGVGSDATALVSSPVTPTPTSTSPELSPRAAHRGGGSGALSTSALPRLERGGAEAEASESWVTPTVVAGRTYKRLGASSASSTGVSSVDASPVVAADGYGHAAAASPTKPTGRADAAGGEGAAESAANPSRAPRQRLLLSVTRDEDAAGCRAAAPLLDDDDEGEGDGLGVELDAPTAPPPRLGAGLFDRFRFHQSTATTTAAATAAAGSRPRASWSDRASTAGTGATSAERHRRLTFDVDADAATRAGGAGRAALFATDSPVQPAWPETTGAAESGGGPTRAAKMGAPAPPRPRPPPSMLRMAGEDGDGKADDDETRHGREPAAVFGSAAAAPGCAEVGVPRKTASGATVKAPEARVRARARARGVLGKRVAEAATAAAAVGGAGGAGWMGHAPTSAAATTSLEAFRFRR